MRLKIAGRTAKQCRQMVLHLDKCNFFKDEWMFLCSKKVVASDKNHRPCLPLKPQEKSLQNIFIRIYIVFKTSHSRLLVLTEGLSLR